MQPSASEGEKRNWSWSWMRCAQPPLRTQCRDGELLEGWAVVGWGQGPSPQGRWGPLWLMEAEYKCHLVCSRLPPGGSGGDHQTWWRAVGGREDVGLVLQIFWGKSCHVGLQRTWFPPNCWACLYFDSLFIVGPQACQGHSVNVSSSLLSG